MDNAPFTHLRVHSHYSLLQATPSIPALVERAKADGLPALALADHTVMYGAIQFAHACHKAGIMPILGLSIPLALNPAQPPSAITLLAVNSVGYRSLCAISSWFQGTPNRQKRCRQGIPLDQLRSLQSHQDGLLCFLGGRHSWVTQLLRQNDLPAASRYLGQMGGIFDDRCYFSLERHPNAESDIDKTIEAAAISLANRFGLPLIAAQPIYILEPGDMELLPLLAAVDRNCRLEKLPADALPHRGVAGIDLHWLSAAEVAQRFSDLPEAIENIAGVINQVEPAIPDGRPLWPQLDLPLRQSAEYTLSAQAQAGFKARYLNAVDSNNRLNKELDIINNSGFAPLFLIVADLARYARQQQIPHNTRGSVANSLVAYCLGITNVDPLVHDLLFERFLNPARQTLPDIDLDFCSQLRDEILHYLRQKYGAERVALVGAMNHMKRKGAVREVGKALGVDNAGIKRLIKQLPRQWSPDPRRRDKRTLLDLLSDIDDEIERKTIRFAHRLIGQPHHLSLHPGGTIIAPEKLTNYIPLQWTPKGFNCAQYDFRDIESVGLPKIDLLGIRALTVLQSAAELVCRHYDPQFAIDGIPLDDQKTGEMLSHGDSIGVFQCESSGAQRTLRQLQARTVTDLAVANAFFKPGPATGGMAAAFIQRYRGEAPTAYLHPSLKPILQHTKGAIIFQEQILRIATEVAGLSWGQADQLRKGMSKFDATAMNAMQAHFIDGCHNKSGLTPAEAEQLWEQVIPFAGYGFNQGHATAYAELSYRMAYLKAHYPAPFLCARLRNYGGFHHPAIYVAEARRLDMAVKPPHINISLRHFTLTHQNEILTLWMGLNQVRDLRRRTIAGILAERKITPFTSLKDFRLRVDARKKELRHLIQCGALDGLGESRAAMLAEAGQTPGNGQLGFDFLAPAKAPAETLEQQLLWERHLLGFPVSANPIAAQKGKAWANIAPIAHLRSNIRKRVVIAGVRLPGWTGGKGFFFGDGDDFIRVVGIADAKIKSWQPHQLKGRYLIDKWGTALFEATEIIR